MVDVVMKQAKEFMEGIGSKDNVAIIYDKDPDGFTSGILFYNYCKEKKAKVIAFPFERGSSCVEDFNLEEFTTIITTDINAGHVVEILEKYQYKKTLFIDHHPKNINLPDSVLEYRTLDMGYIPSARSAYEITGGKYWIGLVGCIGDVGEKYPENNEFIRKGLESVGMSMKEFKERIIWKISNTLLYFHKEPEKAFSLIQSLQEPKGASSLEKYSKPIEKEISKFLELFESKKEDLGGVLYFYFEPKYPLKSVVTTIISLKKENLEKIFLFASPKNDGNNKVSISARNNKGSLDMAKLLKIGIGNLEGESGGHFAASGATIRSEDLEKFKKNIKKYAFENLQ